MRFALFSLLILATNLPSRLLAQEAGGYSAGPGASAPTYEAAPSDAQGAPAKKDREYSTRVVGYRASPSFTQDREFTTTRLWVLDPGKFTVEQWWTGGFGERRATPGPNAGGMLFQTEVEMGVAPHIQVDLYANGEFDQNTEGNYKIAKGGHTGLAAEVRYALGNHWGQYWANPTLYFEVISQYYNSPRAEFRLLLGGEVFVPKLLGALNLAFERNIFRDGDSGIDYEAKAVYGLNYEVVAGILRLGVEGVLGVDSHGTLDAQGRSLLHPVLTAGPSLLLTEPHKRLKLLAAVLHGFSDWDQPWLPTVIVSTSF